MRQRLVLLVEFEEDDMSKVGSIVELLSRHADVVASQDRQLAAMVQSSKEKVAFGRST
jgi:ribosomal protein L10